MNTKLTEILGIQYPVIQGAMQYIATPAFAASVSNAGGLGTVCAAMYATPELFHEALREMNSLTDKPYCVNMSLLPEVNVGANVKTMIEICAQEGVKVIETSGVKPDKISAFIRGAGIYHIHKVPATRYAISARKCGVDAVTIVGTDCGGHPGMDGIGAMVLIDETSRALDIPVIAGGGITDGRGIAAAILLGASAVIMGTRFIATQEAPVSATHKQYLLDAAQNSTILAQQSIRNTIRVANNQSAQKCLELERRGASLEEMMTVISGKNMKAAYLSGNVDDSLFPMGTGCGMIHDIPTVQELMGRMMEEAQQAAESLAARF